MDTIKLYIFNKTVHNPDIAFTIVCGNSDYQVQFSFDDEWAEFETKTARFIFGNNVVDVLFTGDTVAVPIISDASSVKVGVFAGNLHTTTSAIIPCKKSIRCEGGDPVDPTPAAYDQIMEGYNQTLKNYGDVEAALDMILEIQNSLLGEGAK